MQIACASTLKFRVGGFFCGGRKAFVFPIVLEAYGIDVVGVAGCQTHRVNLLVMS